MPTVSACIECGMEFDVGTERESDCPGCHRCYSCCRPDCQVCGNHCSSCGVAKYSVYGIRQLCDECFKG